MAAVGFGMLRGFQPIPWLIAGALVTHYGSHAIGVFDDWMGGYANFRFIPVYMMYLVGAALIMKAWAVAYEPVTNTEQFAAGTPEPAF